MLTGLTSLAKVLIAMERREIPSNLHFNTPNPEIEALSDGRLRVVSKNLPFNGDYVAINSFGFGGTNVHTLLKFNQNVKCVKDHPSGNECRLVTFSARTQEVYM